MHYVNCIYIDRDKLLYYFENVQVSKAACEKPYIRKSIHTMYSISKPLFKTNETRRNIQGTPL